MFDKILLLSKGRTAYSGHVSMIEGYFRDKGFPMPMHVNPAEYLLDLVNTDFASADSTSHARLERILSLYSSAEMETPNDETTKEFSTATRSIATSKTESASLLRIPFTLAHRSCIKSYRDIIAYGIRIAM